MAPKLSSNLFKQNAYIKETNIAAFIAFVAATFSLRLHLCVYLLLSQCLLFHTCDTCLIMA